MKLNYPSSCKVVVIGGVVGENAAVIATGMQTKVIKKL